MPNAFTCDVLIVGAGPAGCAAACELARAGWHVVLVDRSHFPRDKVCGDALISDTLGALDTLRIRERVLAGALRAEELRIYAPSGRFVPLGGRFACLSRTQLDALLLEAATSAGTTFLSGVRALGPLRSADRVSGGRFRGEAGSFEVHARMTLLATGANPLTLGAFGLPAPRVTTAVAGRAYFEAPPDLASRIPHLTIAYDKSWCPGYGWVFPGPAGRFNIGVGLFSRSRGGRLREFWRWFISRFEPAAAIVRASKQLTTFRGAPLWTGLTSPRLGKPGLLVIGEAAAVTYPATGEGIGKAMESGLLAATMVGAALQDRREDELPDAFAREFQQRHLSRYRAYHVAQTWAAYPFVLNMLIARANAGRFVRHELEALVDERGDAHHLFSTRGLLTALVR